MQKSAKTVSRMSSTSTRPVTRPRARAASSRFCTPGQIMSAVALLKENPNPTREEARQALAGNLCRCGAYDHYLNAVERAAGNMREAGQLT